MNDLGMDLYEDEVTVFEIETGFKPVWEVSRTYRCPLIGSCLNTEEHKRILKKAGFRIKGMKLYEVHSLIMQQLNEESKISIKVDNYLKRKYGDEIRRLGNADESELRREWSKRLINGGFDGLFFLACTRRDIPDDLVDEMFGEIHMMSHTGVNAISKVKSELRDAINTSEKFKDQLKRQKQLYRELKKENQSIQNLLISTKKQLEFSKSKTPQDTLLEEHKKEEVIETFKPESKPADPHKENENLKLELRNSQKKVTLLAEQLEENMALSEHLKDDMEELISHVSLMAESHTNDIVKQPIEQDLESKRVLIVGGMTKIKHLYQHMVEMNGGQFEYHDGYMKSGHQNLDAKVLRSDIIICPVNCNSHNACNRLKRLCRKHKKPLKMLPNASVSSISTALFTNEANLNAQHL